MTFFAYGALPLPDSGELTDRLAGLPHSEVLSYVARLGVHTAADTDVAPRTVATVEEVQSRVEEVAALRASLPFGIDGIVIKADLAADQREAGSGTRAPRWAIAYKLPAVEKVTRLLAVEWNVGRTGIIAPRAVLEPVEIDGSTVGYATLHNPADITRRDLRLGDRVMVYKAGDIIPRIEAPVAHLRTGDEKPIDFPEACPQCGSEIDTSEQRWRCVRGRDAGSSPPSRTRRAATSSTSRASARPGSSSSSTRAWSPTSPTCSPSTGNNCWAWNGWARPAPTTSWPPSRRPGRSRCPGSSARSAYAAPGARCHGASPGTSRTWTGSGRPTPRSQRVDGIGKEKAAGVVAELVELAPLIEKLVAAGVNMTEPGATPPPEPGEESTEAAAVGGDGEGDGLPLEGMTVVVTGAMTGALEKLSRNEMNELIERAGWKSSSSVSKRTSLLVAGEKAGSKRTKAEDLGVRIAAPDEFAELVAVFLPSEV